MADDACIQELGAVKGLLPASWIGDDPQASKYIRLKRSLGTVKHWLHEFQRPFRGYKMPMHSDAQDQHDDPADVESWKEAETTVRTLGAELKDWIDLHDAKPAAGPAAAAPTAQAPDTKSKVELRSWTQDDLDNAIRQYKAERATSYGDLWDAVRKNRAGAKIKAKEIYGRNAIARALGVKAPAMVSKSPAWIAIAHELEIPLNRTRRTQGTRHTQRLGKVGHEIAVEEKSAKPESGADNAAAHERLETAERQETIRLINALRGAGKTATERVKNEKAADALIQTLQRGECTDEQARQIVDMHLNPNC